MATLNEIAYNILNIARNGRSSDDDTLSINQIRHWVNYYRGSLLQKYTSNGRKIHPNCLQILIAPVVEGECEVGRIDQVPDVMSFSGQRAIERVETCSSNGWEFPSTITKTSAEELVLYVYYDMTSLDLPTIKESYNSVVDWINTQKYNLDNPQLGLEGHKIKVAYHSACTSERWLDWATTSFTGRWNNACDSGGAGTGRCGGKNLGSVNAADPIARAGSESGNRGGYTGVSSASTTVDCTEQAAHTGGGIADAHDSNLAYGKVWQVQDWVQNSNDVTLNDPLNTSTYNEPPKEALYYDGTSSYEQTSGYNERVVVGSNHADGFVRVWEQINGTWTVVGQNLNGGTGEYFGYSVDISKDGNIIAVGAPQTGGGKGLVRLYEFQDDPSLPNPNTWVQMGSDIVGQVDGDNFGNSVSLSRDGYRVAISAPIHNSNEGTIQVYEYDPNAQNPTWTQMGSDIDGGTDDKAGGSGYGNSIAFKGYDVNTGKQGTVLAVGSAASTNGHVKIYNWNGNSWNQVGNTITGEASGDQFGFSVALNAAGSRVVIGAPGNAGGDADRGEAYVYQNQSGVWTQMGSDIAGESNNSEFGCSVDIDGDGDYIIVGSRLNAGGGTARGSARVYRWLGSDWSQRGADIDGEDDNDNAFAVSITDGGNIVALGHSNNDNLATDYGLVKTYRYFCGSWNQMGSDLHGLSGYKTGWNLSLSNRAENDTIVFYDTEVQASYAVDGTTHASPTLTDHTSATTNSTQFWKIQNISNDNRRIGSSCRGFGPPPAAGNNDNVIVLIFADEASDANSAGASRHGGPYHTSYRPDGGGFASTHWSAPTQANPQGTPVIMDASINNNWASANAGSQSLAAATYTSTTVNVWRYATDNDNTQTGGQDISGYTSQNTSLTGVFSGATIEGVHPSPCWKADWIHHIEKVTSHVGLFKAYLYPTRRPSPLPQLQYNVPFALHAAGAISSGNQTTKDGTYTHDGTTGTVPYSQVVDLSPLYYINPYYTTGYGALDQFGWALNYEMGIFNSEKLQTDLDTLLNSITWTEEIIPSNDGVELCDCKPHIPTNIDRLRFQQFNRFTPGRAINNERLFRWYIEPQGFRYHDKISLILPDWDPTLDLARIWAVFSNPADVPGFHPDFEYPFPDELINALMVEVLQKELNMTIMTPPDLLNDGSAVVTSGRPTKTKKSDK